MVCLSPVIIGLQESYAAQGRGGSIKSSIRLLIASAGKKAATRAFQASAIAIAETCRTRKRPREMSSTEENKADGGPAVPPTAPQQEQPPQQQPAAPPACDDVDDGVGGQEGGGGGGSPCSSPADVADVEVTVAGSEPSRQTSGSIAGGGDNSPVASAGSSPESSEGVADARLEGCRSGGVLERGGSSGRRGSVEEEDEDEEEDCQLEDNDLSASMDDGRCVRSDLPWLVVFVDGYDIGRIWEDKCCTERRVVWCHSLVFTREEVVVCTWRRMDDGTGTGCATFLLCVAKVVEHVCEEARITTCSILQYFSVV